jgi:hypothetical protein
MSNHGLFIGVPALALALAQDFVRPVYVYTAENPLPDNPGQIMHQINSPPPRPRGQAQWGAGIIKFVLVLLGVTKLRAGPGG